MEVVVYGRSVPVCGFCIKMKETLTKKGYQFVYKDITEYPEDFAKLGVRTVPQCVINGVNMGGFDNIMNILKELKA